MKTFFLLVNILALTLPFLGAEMQNQEQPTCHENDKRLFNQNTVMYIPNHYVMKTNPHSKLSYYQYISAAPIDNQYMPYPYYTKPVSVRPHAQMLQWQVLPNIYPPTVVHHPYLHPSFIAIPPKKTQDKTVIPPVNTIAAVESTSIPTNEPTVHSEVIPEASSEFITSTLETTTVTLATTMV